MCSLTHFLVQEHEDKLQYLREELALAEEQCRQEAEIQVCMSECVCVCV